MATNKKKPKKRRNMSPAAAVLILIFFAAGIFLLQRYVPSGKHMNPEEYFGSMGENELAVVLQDHLTDKKAVLEEGHMYLEYSLVQEDLNSRFYWDEENSRMLFTTALETFEIPAGSGTYAVDGEEREFSQVIVLQRDDALYFSADFLQIYTNVEYTVEADSSHVWIQNLWGVRQVSTAKKSALVRFQGSIKSPILTELKKGDLAYVLEDLGRWLRVVTPDGYIGYVRSNRMGEVSGKEISRDFEEQQYSSLLRDFKINLIWHYIDSQDVNQYLKADTQDVTSVNVISPTWYSAADNSGEIESRASEKYVKQAHAKDMEVWALFDNFRNDIDTLTLLSSTEARRNMTDYLVRDALRLGIDGINLDFEYLPEAVGYSYVQFVRELSIACRKAGLVLSVDVPVPMEFNRFFDRTELGTVADYLIIMGYDEHYVGSDPGSVASLGFEERGIAATLEEVPAEKIISGVPFYSRIWYTQTGEDGSESVATEALGMSAAANAVESRGVETEWDEVTCQDYASWTSEDGAFCQIWIENEKSLALKAGLVGQYELGGIAAWRLGLEKASVWEVIKEALN